MLTSRSGACRFDYPIHTQDMYSVNRKSWLPIPFKNFNMELLFYRYCIPVLVTGEAGGSIKVHYLKFTFPFERLFKQVIKNVHEKIIEDYRQRSEDRFYIEIRKGQSLKALSKYAASDSSPPPKDNHLVGASKASYSILEPWLVVQEKLSNRIFGDIYLNDLRVSVPAEAKQDRYQMTEMGTKVLQQVRMWLQAERWYAEHNIPFRRGVLLHGRPGNGKSALVLEIAKRVKIPLFIFDLSSMDNAEFEKALDDIRHAPAIILFEDFDVTFDKRKNLTRTSQFGGLTFDYFINKLSGVQGVKNKFIFITTNHLEKIDECLCNRPGRIDEVIEIPPLTQDEKRKLAQTVLHGYADLIEQVVANGENDTVAEFENRCTQVALDNFWKVADIKS